MDLKISYAWIISASLAALIPVEPTMTIDPQCQIENIDFLIICNLGDVAIGSVSRLLLLCGIAIACNFLCFSFVRVLWRNIGILQAHPYLYQVGLAIFLCNKSGRLMVYTISATLNGILSYHSESRWFDIKTWRIYLFKHAKDDYTTNPRYLKAIPLKS
ncbi:hypothetical protein THRCLA_02915 [Thraustotheca clavata]|uniref:Uncharacterized protein n=1 Tax=Thraustotheca clavata TaxID=74557 RepID=A0A1W0A3W7_9STRA|nr:hypothetical protein THRCLA_02915 [Thraustotheca clavata]